MLPQDLTLDPTVDMGAGTGSAVVYSLLGGNSPTSSIRSAAALNSTFPENLRTSHSVRVAKGFKTAANASVPAPDVYFRRHLFRLDIASQQTLRLDPEHRIGDSIQLLFEQADVGASTLSVATFINRLKAMVAFLEGSSNANAVRLFNGET